MGIQYHEHGRHGNVVESMNVIGHGKESPWGGSVKFFQCGAKTGGHNESKGIDKRVTGS